MMYDDWDEDEELLSNDIDKETRRKFQLLDKVDNAFLAGKKIYLDVEDIEELFDFYTIREEYDKMAYLITLGEQFHKGDELIQLLRPLLLYHQDKNEEALHLMNMLALKHNLNWHFTKVKILIKLGQIEEAKKEGIYIIEEDKENGVTNAIDIANFFLPEHSEEAKRLLHKAIEYHPDDTDLLMHMGLLYAQEDNIEEALHYFDHLIDVDPYSIATWIEKSKVLASHQRYKEALNATEYALAIHPYSHYALQLKAHILIDLEEYDEATKFVVEVQKEFPSLESEFKALQADILYIQNNYSAACKLYRTCLANGDCPIDSMIHYVDIKIEQHHWKKALDICNILLTNFPDDVQLLEHTAQVYEQMGCKDLAAKYLRKCIKLMPEDENLHLLYGGLLLDTENYQGGIRAIKKAYKIAPNAPLTNIMMAVVSAQFYNGKNIHQYLDVAYQQEKDTIKIFLDICPIGCKYLLGEK